MPAQTLGAFWIKEYEFTRSWGIEPGSAAGKGVQSQVGGAVPISVGSFVAYSFLGISFFGIVSSLELTRERESGDEYDFQIVDNRIRLKWAMVFGQWNMEEDPDSVHAEPVMEPPDAIDQLSGGNVGFDQGAGFTGGLDGGGIGFENSVDFGGGGTVDTGPITPGSLAASGKAGRGRMFRHLAPERWAAQSSTLSAEPMSAAQIMAEAFSSAIGGHSFALNFTAVQHKPVFGVDANSGVTLAALVQQLCDEQGLQVTLDGARTLRFGRRGSASLVVPPDAVLKRDGFAISSEPTRVRVVGGRTLVQVNEVLLEPDWAAGWEAFIAEPAWLHAVSQLYPGEFSDDREGRAELAARAREVTLREYISLAGEENEPLEGEEAAGLIDSGRWGKISRMDMPVWSYLNNILFRSYRIPATATLYGFPLRSLEIHDQLLCAVELKDLGGQSRTKYRKDPLEYYPQSAAFVAVQGQPLDLMTSVMDEGFLTSRKRDLRDVWSEMHDFTLDAVNRSIRFATPVFLDGKVEEGKSLLSYPNQAEGVLTEQTDIESPYRQIVIPNPDYEIEAAKVRVALVFRLGIFYRDFGSGPKGSSHQAPALAYHLLHGDEEFSDSKVAAFESDTLRLPDAPSEGFLQLLYEDGSTAIEQAEAQAEGLIVRSGLERSGQYERYGAAGTTLTTAIDRVTTVITREGLKETVDYCKPRPTRGFVSSRDIADRVRSEELFDGQQDLAREVRQLKALARIERQSTDNEKSRTVSHRTMPDVLRKPQGVDDAFCRPLPDPNSQYPLREDYLGWKAGDLVWLDGKNLPSRVGTVFGGVVVMDSVRNGEGEESQPVKFVNVATSGVVPVWVAPGTTPASSVAATPGDWWGSNGGSYAFGMLAHSEAVPGESFATLALIRLNAGGAFESGICPFGEIIQYSQEGDTALKAGIRGGIVYCGDKNPNVEPYEIELQPDRVELISLHIPCESNIDDDGDTFLPGIKTTSVTDSADFWNAKAFSIGPPSTNYDDNEAPDVSDGIGKIVVPLGKLTVKDGVPDFVPVACGHVRISQCGGNISFARE